MNQKISVVLTECRDIIKDQKKWCKEKLALDQYGNFVDEDSPEACSWCSIGILFHVMKDLPGKYKCLSYLRKGFNAQDIAEAQDNMTHEQVIAAWDRAILIAKEVEANQ